MSLLRINHNIAAMNTQRNLNRTSFNLSKTLQRLSSGYRINVAADGPADLIISETLRSQIGGIKAAIRNSQEATNYLNIAEGALAEVSDLLTGLRSLSIHAANSGVVTGDQVAADQEEVNNVLRSIGRINDVTRFAGASLFRTGASATRTFHVGEGGGITDEVDITFSRVSPSFLVGGLLQSLINSGGVQGTYNMSDNPLAAISIVDDAINFIATLRGNLGAFVKNTLYSNINSLSVSLENITATESFIRDANMAEETTNFTKNQILVQSGVSVLAQANVISQSVLQLLQ
jgi:flagellin